MSGLALSVPSMVAARLSGAAAAVRIAPGRPIQAAVFLGAEGATFIIEAGIHRHQTIEPKNGQTFIGAPGAILSGARPLEHWERSGRFWRHPDIPPPLPSRTEVPPGLPAPARGDLYVDDRPLRRAPSLRDLSEQSWVHDVARNSAFVAFDPRGRRCELSVTEVAFAGRARGVAIRNLVVEKYASPPQVGAIYGGDGRDWMIEGTIARLNHGAGIQLGPGSAILGGAALANGQCGINGPNADGAIIRNVHVEGNNWAGYDWNWDAGGIKLVRAQNAQIVGNRVLRNHGSGIWGDIDMRGTRYADNLVAENAYFGIIDEISIEAIIEGNRLLRNGATRLVNGAPPNILIQNSRAATVRHNYVEVDALTGSGIVITSEPRGAGRYGAYEARDNRIVENTIVHLGTRAMVNGMFARDVPAYALPNEWRANTYVVPDAAPPYWMVRGQPSSWPALVASGVENDSRLIVEQRTATALSD